MQSEKVLMMPVRTTDRPPRLRRDENPPYPEYDVEILREVLKINESVTEATGSIKTAESEMRSQGERLALSIRALDAEFQKHREKLEEIAKDVHAAKVTGRVLIVMVIAIASAVGWAITTYLMMHPAK